MKSRYLPLACLACLIKWTGKGRVGGGEGRGGLDSERASEITGICVMALVNGRTDGQGWKVGSQVRKGDGTLGCVISMPTNSLQAVHRRPFPLPLHPHHPSPAEHSQKVLFVPASLSMQWVSLDGLWQPVWGRAS